MFKNNETITTTSPVVDRCTCHCCYIPATLVVLHAVFRRAAALGRIFFFFFVLYRALICEKKKMLNDEKTNRKTHVLAFPPPFFFAVWLFFFCFCVFSLWLLRILSSGSTVFGNQNRVVHVKRKQDFRCAS